MSIERIWAAYQHGAAVETLRALATKPEERFYLAMVANCSGDASAAAALAQQAAEQEPQHAVYVETARYLRTGERSDVYGGPAAFTAFASGGGNVGLYRAVHTVLRVEFAAHQPDRLLDIGTGEGHGLLRALTPDVGHVEVIEPSEQRLAVVTADLTRRGIPHRAHAITAQQFMAGEHGPWDLVQETFALLALSRQDRIALFTWLRSRAKRLALVEFDVPDLGAGLEPRWFRYLVQRYDAGIREYDADRELVAQGFLVPVLLGVLGDSDHQQHHEQPIGRWVDDLAAAGFAPAIPRRLYDYWWAPAYLLTAS
jgi:hypothetical protein